MNRKIYLSERTMTKMHELTKAYPDVENGGIIFGRMNTRWIKIYDVSDAGPRARRSRYGVVFDNTYLLEYTSRKEAEDHFFVGTWHSHPSGCSTYPSSTDKETMVLLSKNFEICYYPVFCITKFEDGLFSLNFYELNEKQRIATREYILF
ncbi:MULTISPECIES: Mov34/MPN/PAD-1 family protein [unclassified Paenibacillus]|uniref:Mov34/MPN/PAD-1 family protein n=1 Tax=unclassified Paenibacillus TaxID=185978 RepID=UPI00070D4FB1|nr:MULTISPECIES: Mov34/MPN/PAD-1 family protein [unclassified Paenibacillus]KQX67244.1 hypothetical protein ASD40_26460 [Paenibacillus sp. Root444D2]KRE49990.1 hypothetical protein ASG85_21290 [Paenibacillus sp. Soil724D2]